MELRPRKLSLRYSQPPSREFRIGMIAGCVLQYVRTIVWTIVFLDSKERKNQTTDQINN